MANDQTLRARSLKRLLDERDGACIPEWAMFTRMPIMMPEMSRLDPP
jgi:hypothetical protein